MRKSTFLFCLLISMAGYGQGENITNETEQHHYVEAKKYFDRSGGNPLSEEHITKAIEINPSNLEYRWIRVRCLMLGSAHLEDFEAAVQDLEYIIKNGGNSGKVQRALGIAYENMGNKWKVKPISSNNSFTDDGVDKVSQRKSNLSKAIECYQLAIPAYEKSKEIDPDIELRYSKTYMEQDIDRLKAEIAEL